MRPAGRCGLIAHLKAVCSFFAYNEKGGFMKYSIQLLVFCFAAMAGYWPAALSEESVPSLYIAGDSTAANGPDNGWGSHLQKFFDPNQLKVVNAARAGRSSRTFITEGLWDEIVKNLKSGDTVLIQFGHNDAGPINDNRRARGSIPSLGDEIQEIDNLVTGRREVVHTFGWYLRKMIADAKAKEAVPIVLSMTARNVWSGGRVERENRFCTLAEEAAVQTGAGFIPFRQMAADQYDLLGPIRVSRLHPLDHTHTNAQGAFLNAAVVVSGLKALGSPLTAKLNEQGRRISAYAPHLMLEPVKEWMTAPWMPDSLLPPNPDCPTLFLIGDSTVRCGSRGDGAGGQWGWGAPIADYFDRQRLNVENCAWGGTSSRTFRTLGYWDKVLARLKPGDFVIMQFGHNDAGPINDNTRARGTLPGVGNEAQEIDNLLTGRRETVRTYGWYIRQYILEAKAKGAVPIVCSPVPRSRWTGGRIVRSADSYAQWAAEAAQAEGAFFIDLNRLVCDRYDSAGQQRVSALYFDGTETTHTNAAGADLNAACVVEGIQSLPDCPLAEYLKPIKSQQPDRALPARQGADG